MSDAALREVRVVAMREEAPDVISCEWRAVAGTLPPCPPGAHVDVHLPNGLVRQYSVAVADGARYVIAVKRDAASRGGSAYVADALRIGTVLRIGAPRDNFPLMAASGRVVLLAGGIGITALLPMARRLHEEGRDFRLHYWFRSAGHAALREWWHGLGECVELHPSDAGRVSISAVVRAQDDGTHYYCCGPASMLQDFVEATAALPQERVHLERFAPAAPVAGDMFTVRLAKSGRTVAVPAGQSIVEALLAAGVDAPYSCQQGICGSCEVRVVAGVPEHRDEVLTAAEKAGNRTMMICCSRARTPELVLDL